MRKSKRFTVSGIAVVLLLIILGGSGVDRLLVSAENIFIKMQIFNLILNEIQKSYIEEVDPIELMEDAIKGMLTNLDPHTTYLPREQFESWFKKFDGFGGIGIYYDIIHDTVTVTSVIDDSPAAEAGILSNDKIIAVNQEKIIGIKHELVRDKLKGTEGTRVALSIHRKKWKKPRVYQLTLRRIFISSVPDAYMLNNEIGYIYLAKFTATSQKELKEAIFKLKSLGMKKLILDLRNNGGGLMHAAIDIVDLFLPGRRKIVFKKGRAESSCEAYFSTGKAPFPELPLLILINHATASSSEIVAGAIQDWDRGIIVGERSFGKGLVQSQIRFADNSALLITTARYYTPSGRLIQRNYQDKTKIEYYREAYDDPLRTRQQQRATDSLIYKSMQGRELPAAGGIVPDIPTAPDSQLASPEIQNLYFFSRTQKPIIARFVENYLQRSELLEQNQEKNNRISLVDFIATFELSTEEWQNFREILADVNFSLTNRQLNENKTDLEFLIMREICFRVWGKYGRFRVKLTRDHQLQDAMQHFTESERLLEASKKLYPNFKNFIQP